MSLSLLPLLAASGVASYWPFIVLAASVLFIIIGISVIRWHPFIALILAAILAGVLASLVPESTVGPDGKPVVGSLSDVVGLVTAGLGKTAGGVAISIGLDGHEWRRRALTRRLAPVSGLAYGSDEADALAQAAFRMRAEGVERAMP